MLYVGISWYLRSWLPPARSVLDVGRTFGRHVAL
jgi:hypothetical protein